MNKVNINGQYIQYPCTMQFTGFEEDGTPIFQSVNQPTKNKPQYVSDTVDNLHYGSVAEQIRNKFKNLGDTATIVAHAHRTVLSSMSLAGYGAKTLKVENKAGALHCTMQRTVKGRNKGNRVQYHTA